MAVIRNPYGVRQRNPLVDELLKKAQAEASNITPAQYTAESYGGRFPIGSLTADILSGVRERNIRKEAEQASAEERDALSKLLQVRGDPEKYQVDASGNITTTSLMPREEVEGFDISQLGRTGTYNPAQTGSGVMLDQSLANTMGTSQEDDAQNLAIALRAAEARKTTGTPASQLEQDMLTEKTTPVTFTYGADKDPNFLDRMLGKSLRKEEISNINDLAIKAGISPFDLQKLDRDIEDRDFARETAKIQRQGALKDNIIKDQQIVANNLQNIITTAESENDLLQAKNANKKLKFINNLTSEVSSKTFPDFKSSELYRAKKFADAGYGDESLKIIKGLKDANLISSLSKKEEINLVKDFRKTEAKEFQTINKSVDIFKKLLDASKADGGVGDYSLMISYIKALDDSVVREGEVRTFASMQGVIKQIEIEFDRAKGEGFPQDLKDQMVDLAFGTLNSAITNYNNNKTAKIDNYKDLGLNPENIFKGYESLNFLDGAGNIMTNSKGDTLPSFVLSVPAKDPEELEFE